MDKTPPAPSPSALMRTQKPPRTGVPEACSVSDKEKRNLLEGARRAVDQLCVAQLALLDRVLAHIEALGPLLAEFESLGRDRIDYVQPLLRAAHAPKKGQQLWHICQAAATLRTGPASRAIAAACWRAGLGRIGVVLPPFVIVEPPAPAYARGDLSTTLRSELGKSEAMLAANLDLALTIATEREGT